MFLLAVAVAAAIISTVPEPSPPEPPTDVIGALIGRDVVVDAEGGGEELAREFVESGDLDTLVETDNVFEELAGLLTAGDYAATADLAYEQAIAIQTIRVDARGQNSALGQLASWVMRGCSDALFKVGDLALYLLSPDAPTELARESQIYNQGTRAELPAEIAQCRVGVAVLDSLM